MKKHQKYLHVLFVLLFAVLFFTGCYDAGDGDNTGTTETYNLRDRGPAGGLIFYINPNAETDGWTYLEAAPQSTEWISKPWGGYGTEVPGADGTAIGTGEQNTADIVKEIGDGDYAAKLCSTLIEGGKSDWFLPSQDELDKIFVNLHSGTDENDNSYTPFWGGASTDYWSSSEYNAFSAWSQIFTTGMPSKVNKEQNSYRVRAVRAF